MKTNHVNYLIVTLTIFGSFTLFSNVVAFSNKKIIKETVAFLKNRADPIIESSGVHTQCAKDLKSFVGDLFLMKRWALEMIDAAAKPSGILSGNYFAFGNFDQCMNIREIKNDSVIDGQYCSVVLTPSKLYSNDISFIFDSIALAEYSGIHTSKQTADVLKQFKLTYGLCLPNSCSIENLQKIWDYIEHAFVLPVHATFTDLLCRSKQKEIEPFEVDKYIITVIVIYFIFILLSTVYDVMTANPEGGRNNIWISFSLYTNFRKIFSYSKVKGNSERFESINGIKVLSMLWIIFGHRMIVNSVSGTINTTYLFEWRQELIATLTSAAHLAVDSFFALSGLLLSYGYLKYKSSIVTDKKINFVFLYVYRFLRLGPGLLATILFQTSVYKKLGDGPIWPIVARKTAKSCYHTWWITLLFLTNFLDFKFQCLEQSWYLAVDSQLFFISPVLLIYLSKRPRRACLLCFFICLLSGIYAFTITLYNDYGANYFEGNKDYYEYLYQPTFVRMPAWVIGFIFGYLIFKYQKIRISKVITLSSWILLLSMIGILVGIHVIFGGIYNSIISAFYNAIVRQLWALTVCSMVFLCTTDHGGIINDFLSLPIFQILVKITYSVYLIHMSVIVYFASSKKHPEYFSNVKGLRDFMGDLLFISIAGTIWCLAFESPFISIGKILINKGLERTLAIVEKPRSIKKTE